MGQSELPLASGREHARVFENCFGWKIRSDGNHIILTHEAAAGVHLSIPNHREVRRGLLSKQIRLAGKTDAEYRKAFDSL
jgi:predicted RNA binding protein YcfA (HicA-like mRNA interferase family)